MNLAFTTNGNLSLLIQMCFSLKNKLIGIGTKKEEVFGVFRRGGFSSKIKFTDHFFEEMSIRFDNGQSRLIILIIFIYKYIKNFNKI